MGAILKPFGNLLSPGPYQVPTGASTIDWTNPLTSNLVGCWLPGILPGGNLVDGRRITINGTPSFTMRGMGPVIDYSASASNWIQLKPTPYLAGSANWSIVTHAFVPNVTQGNVGPPFYCERGTTGNAILKLHTANNFPKRPGMAYRNDAGTLLLITAGSDVSSPAMHVIGCTKNGTVTNGCKVYVDGIVVTQTTWAGANDTLTATMDARSGLDAADAAASLTNQMSFLAIWNRALSDADQMSLALNPYQFLLPAEAEMPGLFLATGGAGFIHSYGAVF